MMSSHCIRLFNLSFEVVTTIIISYTDLIDNFYYINYLFIQPEVTIEISHNMLITLQHISVSVDVSINNYGLERIRPSDIGNK